VWNQRITELFARAVKEDAGAMLRVVPAATAPDSPAQYSHSYSDTQSLAQLEETLYQYGLPGNPDISPESAYARR